MNALIVQCIAWTIRLLLVAVGVLVFVVLTSLFLLLGLVWAIRAGWARLTGKPVNPWGTWMGRVDPRHGFRTTYQSHQRWSGRAHARTNTTQDSAPHKRNTNLPGSQDVVDVQARDVPMQ